MEVKIGVQNAARELSVETDVEPDSVLESSAVEALSPLVDRPPSLDEQASTSGSEQMRQARRRMARR